MHNSAFRPTIRVKTLSLTRMMGVVGLVLTLVTGCATQAQREIQARNDATELGNKQGAACQAAVQEKPEYAEVLALLPVFNVEAMPLGAKLNASYANDQQADALIALRIDMQHCAEIRYAAWQATAPETVAIFREGNAAVDEIFASLIRRQATWGEGASRLQKATSATIMQVRKHEAGAMALANSSHAAEMQRRASIAGAIQSNLAQQQMVNSLNRPRSTNCNTFGTTVNCTSY